MEGVEKQLKVTKAIYGSKRRKFIYRSLIYTFRRLRSTLVCLILFKSVAMFRHYEFIRLSLLDESIVIQQYFFFYSKSTKVVTFELSEQTVVEYQTDILDL